MIHIKRPEYDADKAPLVLWDNLLLGATVTASTEATDSEVENLLTDSTFDFWKPETTSGTVTATFASTTTASAVGIAAHNLGSLGATIAIRKGTTTLFTVTPTDDTPMLILFSSNTFGASSTTRFSIEITGASSAFSIGNLFFGVPLVFETGILGGYTPLWMAETIELLQNTSLGGQFFQNRIIRKSADTSVNLNILDRAFIEGATFQGFRNHYNSGKTFFWAAGPSVFEEDVAYARRSSSEMKPTFQDNGIFYNVGLDLEAYVG